MAQWPWPRAVFAAALARLSEAGAKVVIFDLIFSSPSVYGPADDQAFAEAIATYRNQVILGQTYSETSQRLSGGTQVYSQQVTSPLEILAEAEPRIGLVNLPIASNGQILHLQPQQLPLVAEVASDIALSESLGINYRGGQTTYPVIPLWQVFEPTFWTVNLEEGALFDGAIVLIGDTTAIGQDLWPTPFDPLLPGVMIHAQAIDTLLSQTGLRPAPGATYLPMAVALLVGLLLWPVPGVLAKVGVSGVLVAGVGFLGYGLFLWGWTTPLMSTLVPAGGVGLADATLAGIQAQQTRQRLRRILERRVSPAVLNEILQQPAAFAETLGGQVRTVAVLFSDLRNFTSIAAIITPKALVTLLNSYFEVMMQPILAEKGTVDKFIGDAIMAVFGAPLVSTPSASALAAVTAALGMRQALATLTTATNLHHGIGINLGEVIAGHIGTQQRMDYTVIGDAVNVASRVEGLCKQLQRDILITEAVYTYVRDRVQVEDMGWHTLKGKAEPIQVYAVIDWQPTAE